MAHYSREQHAEHLRLHPKYKIWAQMEIDLLVAFTSFFLQFYRWGFLAVKYGTVVRQVNKMNQSDRVWFLRDIESVGGAFTIHLILHPHLTFRQHTPPLCVYIERILNVIHLVLILLTILLYLPSLLCSLVQQVCHYLVLLQIHSNML
jgi:uncharacterized membrane protein YqaE (UPF0057 family)